jgi:hypothetical protein
MTRDPAADPALDRDDLMTVGQLIQILLDTNPDPSWMVPRHLPIAVETADGTHLGYVQDASGTFGGDHKRFALQLADDDEVTP